MSRNPIEVSVILIFFSYRAPFLQPQVERGPGIRGVEFSHAVAPERVWTVASRRGGRVSKPSINSGRSLVHASVQPYDLCCVYTSSSMSQTIRPHPISLVRAPLLSGEGSINTSRWCLAAAYISAQHTPTKQQLLNL